MPTKVNIVLDEDVTSELDLLVKSGLRSRLINKALRQELQSIRRQQASKRIDVLRGKTKAVSCSEIVKLVRRDRGRCPSQSSFPTPPSY
jgi:metal-responsive CopG/Arc/MetJ family transcriptional regulator